jgi:hypothetical protein
VNNEPLQDGLSKPDFRCNGLGDDAVFGHLSDALRAANRVNGNVRGSRSSGRGAHGRVTFGPAELWHNDFCRGSQGCRLGDINRDGRIDIVVSARDTYSKRLASGRPCVDGEHCDVADMNGDGAADLIVFQNGANRATNVFMAATTAPASSR